MEINLLPRPSFYEKYRVAVLAGAGLLVVGIAFNAIYAYTSLNNKIAASKSDLVRIKSDIIVLQAERTVAPEMRRFQELQQAVDGLKQGQNEFGEILDGIAAQLSRKSRVTAASFDSEKQALVLELSSESVEVIAEYETLLRTEPWVADVFVEKIENDTAKEEQEQAKPSLIAVAGAVDEPLPAAESQEKKERPYAAAFTILLVKK